MNCCNPACVSDGESTGNESDPVPVPPPNEMRDSTWCSTVQATLNESATSIMLYDGLIDVVRRFSR